MNELYHYMCNIEISYQKLIKLAVKALTDLIGINGLVDIIVIDLVDLRSVWDWL